MSIGMGKSSTVWRYFHPARDGKATCKICEKQIKCSKGSTSGLKNHLTGCHKIDCNARPHPELQFPGDVVAPPPQPPQQNEPVLVDISEENDDHAPTVPVEDVPPPTPPLVLRAPSTPLRTSCWTPRRPTAVAMPTTPETPAMGTYRCIGCHHIYDRRQGFFKKKKPYSIQSREARRIDAKVFMHIIDDLKPLDTVNGRGFIQLCKELDERYNQKSRTFYTRLLETVKGKCEETMREQIKDQHLSFTMDIWSKRAISILSITCQYVDEDFMLHSLILAAMPLGIRSTWRDIKAKFDEVKTRYGIKEDQVVLVIRDQGGNIRKALDQSEWSSSDCTVHEMQLALRDGLKNPKAIRCLKKIKKIVRFFNKSPKASKILVKIQEDAKVKEIVRLTDEGVSRQDINAQAPKVLVLKQAVVTRWNSDLHMAERFMQLRSHLATYQHQRPGDIDQHMLTASEWVFVDNLVFFLKPFDRMTNELCRADARASQILPSIKYLEKKIEEATHMFDMEEYIGIEDLTDIQDTVEEEMTRRFRNLKTSREPMIATALDSRFKTAAFNEDLKRDVETWLKEEADKLFPPATLPTEADPDDIMLDQYVNDLLDAQPEPTPPPAPLVRANNFQKDFAYFMHSQHAENGNKPAEQMEIDIPKPDFDKEWAQYLAEPPLADTTVSPLSYWRQQKEVYPCLAALARKFLSAPPTSVDSERFFSLAMNIYTQ